MLPFPGLRILLDYRPALRARTGVGEYAHELAGDTLTLFSSSWKDRLSPGTLPGARVIDRRVPVTVLNAAWHRAGWPPIEMLAGPQDIVHSLHPLLMPSRRARQVVTVHDLDFLDHPERTQAEIRRDYRILFMGTLEPRKNVGVLLAAYAALIARKPDAPPLWLAGGATEAAAPWLREIAQPPLAGRVEHLGYVATDRRYDLYARASMLVLPSHLEGFGLPVLEAMTAGVPVIVSNRGALPEVAGDAAQIVEADAAGGFAEAMRRYLEDPAFAAAAVARGLARARAYSWDASARTLLAAYHHLRPLDGARGRPERVEGR